MPPVDASGRRRPSRAPRTPMPERDPIERARDFEEVALGYSEEQALAEADRCLQCANPTCIAGCPVNIDIKSFIARILERDYAGGVAVIKERNALPAVCGRVCPQEEQCEAACVLARKGEPVAIGRLERFLGDFDLACDLEHRCQPEVGPDSGYKVAVIGSGPAGLACAGELRRFGHAVTVFESLHAPGGVLTYGIPEFRLPKTIVAAEIEALAMMGVELVTDAVIGATYTLDELMGEQGFDAVFIGVGAGLPVFLGVPGENLNGVYSANEFLTRVNLMRAYEFPKADTPVRRGRKVAVVGGGNVAMDAARTAKRLGAEQVFLVYRRSEEEMPARREEVHHAREEGIEFKMLCSPQEIVGKDGWVTGMVVTDMQLGEPDASGRRSPVCVVGSEHTIECDTVIVAVGTRANPLLTKATPGLEVSSRGYVLTDDEGATSLPGVFAGGDIVTGSATVILAMGAGKRAARAIDRYLRERG
ncbi:NADPH-dependent glutamate synthase [Coriobacteriia bacterium Es71-Z0120]|uniref:NADPH-dependent glutamate synthase n=1 Tax=Parvivirga hydrogeniphila TaxID=2939460 RepID=UPI002260A672|nr:NADPH-dependent glutamate synthase [Parvivirga hydrogeniphila]MCL4079495.1 NADPH-dependent glutamate synthase [Parvivirga hydrogeniphila]